MEENEDLFKKPYTWVHDLLYEQGPGPGQEARLRTTQSKQEHVVLYKYLFLEDTLKECLIFVESRNSTQL
jgi:hypothetical protein